VLGSEEDLKRSELDQESKFGETRDFEWQISLIFRFLESFSQVLCIL
jgi:hypothetical protein